MDRRTLIFAKRPAPGVVKTRLVPALTPEQAAELAQAMLDDRVQSGFLCHDFSAALAVAPAEAGDWARDRYPHMPVIAQQGADLAGRMSNAFESTCSPGRSVVIIGSDCPLLSARTVAEAHVALETGADVVIAPDSGGGYCLIGMRRNQPQLFSAVPMSTDDMCAETVRLAEGLGLRVELLPEHYDVDEPADLQRLTADLESRASGHPRAFPHRTFEFLKRFQSRVS